jgi:hypothetical protein
MSTPRPLTELEARWLLPRIHSTRRSLRVAWMIARLASWFGGLTLIGAGILVFTEGKWDKAIVILPGGLFLGLLGFGMPTGKSKAPQDAKAESVVTTWRGNVDMVRVPQGKSHTHVPTLGGVFPLQLPPGWEDDFVAKETVEVDAVEALTPGLHHFDKALFVVSLHGRRSLHAELEVGLASAAPGAFVTWFLAGVVGVLLVVGFPTLRPADHLSGVVGFYGGLFLYLLLGRWLWRRDRGVFRRCAAASKAYWEAHR